MSPSKRCNLLGAILASAGIGVSLLSLSTAVAVVDVKDTQEHDLSFLPDKYAISLGYGLSRRPFFGQENIYREAVQAAGAAHWKCVLVERCSFLVKAGYLRFLGVPRSNNALKVEQLESRLSAGLGIESTAVVPVGVSMSAASVGRTYEYKVASSVTSESTQNEWKESDLRVMIDFWLGVPLIADFASLNLTLGRFLSVQSPEDQSVYGVELRFNY
jgi:hypothetical protein